MSKKVRNFKFYCNICEYRTTNKYDWNKHLNTNKHIQKEKKNKMNKNLSSFNFDKNEVINNKESNMYICPNCNKKYKFSSGLSRHKKKCNNGTEEYEYVNNNVQLERQNAQINNLHKILEKTIQSQNETLNKLALKVGNTTNNIQNKMTINLFLNEECKNAMNFSDFLNSLQLSLEDLEYTKDNGYIKGITNIFVKNLKGINPLERPIHCSDQKKLQFYVKDENEWNEDEKNKKIDQSIEKITQKQIQQIKEWELDNPDWNKTEAGSQAYMQMITEIMGGANKKNKGDNIENIKKQLGHNINISNLVEEKNMIINK